MTSSIRTYTCTCREEGGLEFCNCAGKWSNSRFMICTGVCLSGECDSTLAALRRLEELYDRVYLIIENSNTVNKYVNELYCHKWGHNL